MMADIAAVVVEVNGIALDIDNHRQWSTFYLKVLMKVEGLINNPEITNIYLYIYIMNEVFYVCYSLLCTLFSANPIIHFVLRIHLNTLNK